MGTNAERPVATGPPSRWDHETLRAAAQRPIAGPGATNTLAALGGLELPSHESRPVQPPREVGREPIPGERDASTLTVRKPGAIGGRFSSADTPPVETSRVMDPATIHDRELEGGGST
jgi:hypothetical protein